MPFVKALLDSQRCAEALSCPVSNHKPIKSRHLKSSLRMFWNSANAFALRGYPDKMEGYDTGAQRSKRGLQYVSCLGIRQQPDMTKLPVSSKYMTTPPQHTRDSTHQRFEMVPCFKCSCLQDRTWDVSCLHFVS